MLASEGVLKSGVFTELGDREETYTGTPQGGILSPLLANIALSALDDHFDQQWREEMERTGSGANAEETARAPGKLSASRMISFSMVSGYSGTTPRRCAKR